MPTQCSRDLFGLAPVEGRRVEAAFDGGDQTSDAERGASVRPIRRLTRSTGSPPASKTAAPRPGSSTASRPWWAAGVRDRVEIRGSDRSRSATPGPGPHGRQAPGQAQRRAPLAGKSTLNRLEHVPVAPSRYLQDGP
jgi:hypothetical protein